MSAIEFFKISVEDTDGDLVDVSGDSRDELVTITLNPSDEEWDAYFAELSPENARALAAALVMAATAAEGRGIGL